MINDKLSFKVIFCEAAILAYANNSNALSYSLLFFAFSAFAIIVANESELSVSFAVNRQHKVD